MMDCDDEQHEILLDEIRNLDKPGHCKKKTTIKPKKQNSKKKSTLLEDLVGTIASTRNVSALKKHLDQEKSDLKKGKQNKLSVPIHRQALERTESTYAYKKSKDELSKWDAITHHNRVAEQLVFPLNDTETFHTGALAERALSFKPETEIERQLAEALGTSRNINETVEKEDPEVQNAMNLQEALKRTEELKRLRMVQSYAAAKQAREAKIKSKKYRKVRKREKRKKMIKDIEDLIEKNPDAAKEKLSELDRDRVYERATLKHRNTGKWSTQLKQYASRNPGMQRLITDHLKLGRELKSKQISLNKALDSDDDTKQENEDDKDENHKPLTRSEILELAVEQARRELKEEREQQAQEISEKIQKGSEVPELKQKLEAIRKAVKENEVALIRSSDQNLVLKTSGEENTVENDEFFAQAFDADDVIREVLEEQKAEKTKKSQSFQKKRNLRGWGAWTGPNSVKKEPKTPAKPVVNLKTSKQADKKMVFVRDQSNKLELLQPRDVPFPFTAVKDFEAVIRQPIGRDWNTNTSHRKMIRRSVVTKAGRIIKPMLKVDDQTVPFKK